MGSAKRHSPQHALLAGLPFKGCVTTNFDELFELAVRGAGAEMAVLPTDVGRVTDRWCLKPPLTLTLALALALAEPEPLGTAPEHPEPAPEPEPGASSYTGRCRVRTRSY